jgi:glycosyltransferase involved in cell wall biosynthesis
MDHYFTALVAGRKRMSKSVAYISYDGMTDALGQSQVIPYLIGLTQYGYTFTIISCEKKENYEANKSRIAQLLSAHNIAWHPLSYTKSPPVISTLYDVYRIKKRLFRLHSNTPFDIVHCRSYIAALAGLQMKQRLQVKFIFDMRGLWADERVDGKLWNLKNPVYHAVYRFFKKKEQDFLEQADYTISLTTNARNEILTWKHVHINPEKISVIPCCADLCLFSKTNIQQDKLNAFKSELKITANDFVVLYLGSIGTWYMLDEMMEFFSVLKTRISNARFLFVTRDEHERILKTAEKFGVSDAVLIRPGAREEIPYLITLCNYSIFFILPSYSKKASSPTKQAEIMAMGKPVVCNTNVGDTDKIITDYKSGILVKEFTKNAYLKAIDEMKRPFSENEIISGALDYFSLESGIKKYAAVYEKVLA